MSELTTERIELEEKLRTKLQDTFKTFRIHMVEGDDIHISLDKNKTYFNINLIKHEIIIEIDRIVEYDIDSLVNNNPRLAIKIINNETRIVEKLKDYQVKKIDLLKKSLGE